MRNNVASHTQKVLQIECDKILLHFKFFEMISVFCLISVTFYFENAQLGAESSNRVTIYDVRTMKSN